MSQSSNVIRVPCPFCAEEILPKAIKCPHCSEWLTAATGQDNSERRQQNADTAQSVAQGVRADRHREGHFVMKTLVGAAVFALIIYLVGGLDSLILGLAAFLVIFLKARKDYYSEH